MATTSNLPFGSTPSYFGGGYSITGLIPGMYGGGYNISPWMGPNSYLQYASLSGSDQASLTNLGQFVGEATGSGELGSALGMLGSSLGSEILNAGSFKGGLKNFAELDMLNPNGSNMRSFGTKDFGGFGKMGNLAGQIGAGILDRSTEHQRTSGKYGSIAAGVDQLGGFIGNFGNYGGYSVLGLLGMSTVNKITGGTDGMTVADSLLGSSSLAGGLTAINPIAGAAYIAVSGVNSATGKTTDKIQNNDFMSQEELDPLWASYNKSQSDHLNAMQYGNKKYGGISVLTGSFGRANTRVREDNRRTDNLLKISRNRQLGNIRGSQVDINSLDYRLNTSGGYNLYGTYIGRKGMKLPTKLDIDRVKNILNSRKDIKLFKKGGQMNVIPEGALHARLHHMDIDNNITRKGIPVIDNDGEQQAEIERNEIIFSLDVTNKLEAFRRDGSDAAAIKAGKLLVDEIFHNTDDRTGLIQEVIGTDEAKKPAFKDGGMILAEEPMITIEAEEPEIEKFQEGGIIEAEEPSNNEEEIELFQGGGKSKKSPKLVWKILNSDENFDDGFIDEPDYNDDLSYQSLPESVKGKITENEWEDFLDDLFSMKYLVGDAKRLNPRFIQRLSEEPKMIEFIDDNGNKVKGSHYLNSGEDEFGGYVYPQIQELSDGSLKFILDKDEALDAARKNNNILRFDSPMDAFRFSTRYKRFFPEYIQQWNKRFGND